MTTGAGFLKPYGNKIEFADDQTKYLFFVEGDSGNDTGMRVRPSGIYRDEEGSIVRAVEMDTGTLYGKWYLTDVDENEDYTLIHRLYADGRYLRSVTNLTAPLTFAGSEILYGGSGIQGFGNTVSVEEGILYGDWSLDSVLNADEAIITRSFADARYPLRSEGITTNRVIQAGDTLVISNGLITAIIP